VPTDDNERDAFKTAVENVLPAIALSRSHPATVQTEDIDGRVSVQFDNGGPLPGASGVDRVYGLPGCVCSVPQGTRARIEFDNGNPCKRTFGTYDAGCPVTKIEIATPSIDQLAARKGDTTTAGTLSWEQLPFVMGLPVGGILTLSSPLISGSPEIGIVQWLVAGPIVITQANPPSSSPSMELKGVITSGSTIVKIGG
jgi:hypothetical protein